MADAVDRAGDLYDRIGGGYAVGRRTEPRIAEQIWAALGDAETVLNVGAGAGSYEPADRWVTALEPSAVMRAQRPAGSAPCIAGAAEALPFADGSFDAAMAVLSDHHWNDPMRGWREMHRVATRVVVLQWDNTWIPRYWLVRDYLPEFARLAEAYPSLHDRAAAIGARMATVPIPWDCADGFFHAYWRRPWAYLDDAVRRATSVWARVGQAVEGRVVEALCADLASGAWANRNADLAHSPEADLGARLVVAE